MHITRQKPQTRKVKPDIDWVEALRLQRESYEAGDKDAFISKVIPVAEYYAEARALHYLGKNLSTQVDAHQLFSAAMQAVMEVSEKKLAPDAHPDKLRNLCAVVIKRRMHDLERRYMEKLNKGRIDRPYEGLPDFVKDIVDANRSSEQAALTPETSLHYKETVDAVIGKLEKILKGQQLIIMKAIITQIPQGYNMQDVANSIGKSRSTVESTRSHVRTILKKHHPEVAAEISEILIESSEHQPNARF